MRQDLSPGPRPLLEIADVASDASPMIAPMREARGPEALDGGVPSPQAPRPFLGVRGRRWRSTPSLARCLAGLCRVDVEGAHAKVQAIRTASAACHRREPASGPAPWPDPVRPPLS